MASVCYSPIFSNEFVSCLNQRQPVSIINTQTFFKYLQALIALFPTFYFSEQERKLHMLSLSGAISVGFGLYSYKKYSEAKKIDQKVCSMFFSEKGLEKPQPAKSIKENPSLDQTFSEEEKKKKRELEQQLYKQDMKTFDSLAQNPQIIAKILQEFELHPSAENKTKIIKLFDFLLGASENWLLVISSPLRFLSLKKFVDNEKILKDLIPVLLSKFFKTELGRDYVEELLIYMIEKDLIKAASLSNEDLVRFWSRVSNDKLAKVALKKGFDINTKNEQGETALMALIKQAKRDDLAPLELDLIILTLLKNQATFPDLEKEILINESYQSISSFLKDKPSILALLKQAKKYILISPNKEETKNYFSKLLSDCRVWKPINQENVSSDFFRVQEETIILRVIVVASFVMTLYLAVAIHFPFSFVTGLTALFLQGLVPVIWYHYDFNRADQKLTEVALERFQEMFPPSQVAQHLISREKAIDELISKNIEMTKVDDTNHTLWDYVCSRPNILSILREKLSEETRFSNFKKLADHLFKNSLTADEKYTYFIKAIENPPFIDYLLEQNKIKATDLSPLQQFTCLEKAHSLETLQCLKRHGFDVNAENEEGLSPLLSLLSGGSYYFSKKHENLFERLKFFLEGAKKVKTRTQLVLFNTLLNKVQDFVSQIEEDSLKRDLRILLGF